MKLIPLTQGKFAKVDDADFEELSKFKWHAFAVGNKTRPRIYAARSTENTGVILMHRVIMQPPKGLVVDHIDGDCLNNQRENLRNTTNRVNRINSWEFRAGKAGLIKVGKKYAARADGKHLGMFPTSEEAFVAYRKYHSIELANRPKGE